MLLRGAQLKMAFERDSFLAALIYGLIHLVAMALDASPAFFSFWGLLIVAATTNRESKSQARTSSSLD